MRYINSGINKSSDGHSALDPSTRGKGGRPVESKIQKSPLERSDSCKQYLDEGDMALLTSIEIEQAVKRILD